MRTTLYLTTLCAALALVAGAPAPIPEPNPDPAAQPDPAAAADDRPEIIEIIAPAASAQETLATLNLGAPGSELSERNKRTIGILRQLFPTLTQIIEQKVQQITSSVVQAFGPVVLRLFLGGGNKSNSGGGTIELDDDDDDDDDDEPAPPSSSSTVAPTTAALTTAAPTTAAPTDAPTTIAPASSRRRRALYYVLNAIAEENQLLSGAESQQAEVRVAFGEGQQDQVVAASDDQQTAAQTNSASIDEISLDDADSSEENRNKRFLSFGGNAGASGGGSGNFLFDIVRLVAGSSSGSSGGDAAAGGDADDAGAAKGDNLTEGVPGPITRLFIIANRGIANLIQDLILRIAQTSERIVNFKARLITSII
ncbi:unnamed protein product [Arctia plantaginis]|uniref:Uncharacterized protein n=1 Tax=Arctia plantaginis TaxID=874455 RepID=A0A8S1B2L1_ARCPL|nr:unnamed protein product [Arctia plantaginis]